MRTLVVGANGDVGSRTTATLVGRGAVVRGSVRERGRAVGLPASVEVVEADLTSAAGLGDSLRDVETMVLTANAVAPRRGDDPKAVEHGLSRAVEDAEAAGVRRVVLASIPTTPSDHKVAFARARRALEDRLASSPLETSVLRFPPFMETWLALVGSSIPLRGDPHATIGRPSPFLRTFRRGTATLVERRGRMLVPGPADRRHAFIAAADVARALAEAALRPDPLGIVEVAGPEVLSWRDVAAVFSDVLAREVKISATPEAVFAAMSTLLRPVAAVPSNTMGLNRYLASADTVWTDVGGGLVDPASMTTVREFLAAKAELPEELPAVV